MPVVNAGTPTVNVSVPVPTPVRQPKRPPVSFGGESDGVPPQQPTGPTGVPPQTPPKRRLSAVILPWSPPPKQTQPAQMKRKTVPRRYADATNHEALAVGIKTLSSPAHESTRRGGNDADRTFRGQLADLLQDHEREEEANLLRSNRPVFVHRDQVRAVPRSVEIRGRRWFQRTYGNTYHTAHVYVDGKHVLSIPRQYGYGDQYADTAMNELERQGLIPPRERYQNGGREANWQWRDRHGIDLDTSVEDVRRQRDLDAPPPPSRYRPPPAEPPAQMRRLPCRAVRYSATPTDLAGLFRAARENPHEPTHHAVIADALDEAYPGNHVSGLIRRQFGFGEYGGRGEQNNLWYEPVENSWDGTFPYAARLGTHGPFDLYLRHEQPNIERDNPAWRTGGSTGSGNARWVLHAVSRLKGSRDFGYTFEFPHESAHEIPRMFPGAEHYINRGNTPPENEEVMRLRQQEADRFNVQMDQREQLR